MGSSRLLDHCSCLGQPPEANARDRPTCLTLQDRVGSRKEGKEREGSVREDIEEDDEQKTSRTKCICTLSPRPQTKEP